LKTDAEIIDGCRLRHPSDQEALYKRSFATGMSVALRYARSREDALEILNDAFLKVFTHIDRYDSRRPFQTWFRRIVVNTALDRYRADRRQDPGLTFTDEVPEVAVDMDGIEHLDVDDILRLFRMLPEHWKLVYNLFEVDGYTHEEIGQILNIAPGTSRSHLTRARQRLQALYHAHIMESRT
jgi:RNA polymerase sigma-70 factor (ECF subfamily)